MFLFSFFVLSYRIWHSMTEEQEKILESFEHQVRRLIAYCDKLKVDNEKLRKSLAQKEKEISEANEIILQWVSKYDNLKLAKIISTDDEEMKKTKKRLSSIVREIDKCIALLNE